MKNYNVNYRCRKAAFLLVLALLSALLLSACNDTAGGGPVSDGVKNGSESDVLTFSGKYTAAISAASDSVEFTDFLDASADVPVYAFWMNTPDTGKNESLKAVEKDAAVNLLGYSLKGTLTSIVPEHMGDAYLLQYDTEDGNFSFKLSHKTKQPVYYMNYNAPMWEIPEDGGKSKEECLEIANKVAKEALHMDVSEYTVTVTEKHIDDDETKPVSDYAIYYRRYIGDVRTADNLSIQISKSGEVNFYSGYMIGQMKDVSTEGLSMEKAEEAMTAALKKSGRTSENYEILYTTLTKTVSGELAVLYTLGTVETVPAGEQLDIIVY